jgi:hypothetical protein
LNKTGYVFSLIGGVLAVVFSVLLVITGPYFFAGSDVSHFISANSEVLPDGNTNLGLIWTDIGDYYGLDPILKVSFDDYISGYQDVFHDISADDLDDMADKYDMDSFHKLSVIYGKFEDYLPKLEMGVIACLAASIIALVGAQVARRYRAAGGAMVLSAAALTLIFSLIASSILPMALASVILVLGGLLQLVKPKESAALSGQQAERDGGVF